MKAKQLLKECKLFSELSNAQLEKVASSALEKEYDAGTTIFQEGDSADELLVLQKGKVAVQTVLPGVQTERRKRITVDVVTGNEIVGWSALVEPYIYTLTAVCLQKVNALSISGNKLRWLLEENHDIGYAVVKGLIKVVASRLDETRHVLISERLLMTKPE